MVSHQMAAAHRGHRPPMLPNTILLVEDDPMSGLMLQSVLQAQGLKVELCQDGQSAWELWQRKRFRLVVSDWKLPGMDGIDLCRKIRAAETDYVYFILITVADLDSETETAAIESGVDDFLPKPVNQSVLRNRLRVARRFIEHTERIRRLEGLLPICSYCHKVRDDRSYWQQIEAYLGEHHGTRFTHGICPECFDKHVLPELQKMESKSDQSAT